MWFTKSKQPSSPNETESYRFSPPDLAKFRDASKTRPLDDRVPLVYVVSAEAATAKGVTLQEFLHDDLKRALASHYPTADCLDVDEIAAVAAGEVLAQDRMSHFSECEGCTGAAAGASSGSPSGIDKVWASLQASVKDAKSMVGLDLAPTFRATPVFDEPIFDNDAVTKATSPFVPPPFLKATR